MSLSQQFKAIQAATDIMMVNVQHLHDNPFKTVKKIKK